MKIKLFSIFVIVISVLLLANCSNQFSFVFMPDIHIQPERQAPQGFRQAIDRVNTLQPDFVITGGDLISDALGQTYGRADSLYRLYADLRQIFAMPVYDTIGNHEVFGLYEKSGVDSTHQSFGKAMFANRLGDGRTFRSFDYKNWHFILLDAVGLKPAEHRYFGHVDSVQIEWLKDDLAQLDSHTPVCVVTHIPFTTVYGQMKNGALYQNNSWEVISNSKQVLDVFSDVNLKLVLQGHLHVVEDIAWKGTHFITGGAVSAAWWQGARDGFEEGFVVVDVEGDQFDWRYETYGWDAVKVTEDK